MPVLFYLLSKWWKQLAGIILVALAVATAFVLIQPRQYLSVSTALPASSSFADKSRIFNENIQSLYSVMGGGDELDKIVGTGQLDTIYLAIADKLNLVAYYKIKQDKKSRIKAATELSKNSKVFKSEYGELKVQTWDKDAVMAAILANSIMDMIKTIHSDLQNSNNKETLENLLAARQAIISTKDSSVYDQEQLLSYDKLIKEYQLMSSIKPAALLVVEKARPDLTTSKPKIFTTLLITTALSCLFGLLLILVLERKTGSAK